jgi:hypothetical protein
MVWNAARISGQSGVPGGALAVILFIGKRWFARDDRDEPLSVVEDGDTWIVQGRPPPTSPTKGLSELALDGPFKMRISQFDGQILDCVFVINIPIALSMPPVKQ